MCSTTLRIIVFAGFVCAAYEALAPPCSAHPGIDQQIRDITARVEQTPTDATLYLRRGELHRIHREWKLAEADYRVAAKLDPGLAAVDACLGQMRLEAGDFDGALRAVERYLDKRPGDPRGWATLARAQAGSGRNLEAASAFTHSLELDGSGAAGPEYYLERARALEAAGPEHVDTALRGLDEGLRALGYPASLEHYAIELELAHGRYDAALDRLARMASGSERQERWLIRQGEVLELAGRPEDARSAYRRALSEIEALPPSRRRNRAVLRLEETARDALTRLDVD